MNTIIHYLILQNQHLQQTISFLLKFISSLKFSKDSAHIMALCLTLHVNLGLSLRKTAYAMHNLYGVKISHQMVANYARTAAIVIKPFVDNFNYQPSNTFVADETYIKVRGVKGYIRSVMDAVKRSVLGYQVSDNRGVAPCILSMRMAFREFKDKLPEGFRFIADGFSAYLLSAQQFFLILGDNFKFDVTQVIGLANDDEVCAEFKPYKQMIERLNRTFLGYRVLNKVDILEGAENMPVKWQLLIFLGQQTILHLQTQQAQV